MVDHSHVSIINHYSVLATKVITLEGAPTNMKQLEGVGHDTPNTRGGEL